MFCEKCGNQISDGVAFCSSCGAPLNEKVRTESMPVQEENKKEIKSGFGRITSSIPLNLIDGEVPIVQSSAAFVKSSIAQGTLTLTNKRILFTKDGAGKAFFKRGGLLGMAMSAGADIPPAISLDDITSIESTSCIQGKAAMLVTVRSGYQYKIALQSMALGKTSELCDKRDRIIELVRSAI